ncbi:MAG: ferritin-like domain-containing protein [Thiotrichales bacterium]|nr:ferritin-like domain-containing protein [Thiotrichales bacterium]
MKKQDLNKYGLPVGTDLDQDLHNKFSHYQANRRAFMRGFAALGAGLVGSAMLSGCNGGSSDAVADDVPSGPTDAQVLNFALNLEYLEAEFYLIAATGMGLNTSQTSGLGSLGMVTGGQQVMFDTPLIEQYANEIAGDERDHVDFLRAALGSAAVARPAIDFVDSFTAAARAAGLIDNTQTFDPFANENNFLLAAYIFEDVGVTAYKGASPFISNKTFLEAAAGLLAAEAYHAGLVRSILSARGVDAPGLIAAANAISDARDSLDGDADIDQGLASRMVDLNGASYTASNIVPLDANGLAYSRSPGQVLNIVYLNPNAVSAGGFFPDGVNGDIRTSAGASPATPA